MAANVRSPPPKGKTELAVSPTPKVQLAVSAIIERNGRYLLARRGNPPAAMSWAFPGGRVEAGETTRDAIIREVMEETGLEAKVDRVFDVFDFTGSRADGVPWHYTLIVFFVQVADFTPMRPGDDAAALQWYHPDETPGLTMPPSMHDAMARLGNLTQK